MLPDDISVHDYAAREDGHPPLQLAASTAAAAHTPDLTVPSSPLLKTRSLSDGDARPPSCGRLSPSPLLLGPQKRLESRDDNSITSPRNVTAPMTPRRLPPSVSAQGHPPPQLPGEQIPFSRQPQQQQHQQQQRQSHDQKDQPPTTPIANTHLHHQLQQQQQQHLYLDQPMYMSSPIPLSPKLDSSQIYASHTNILPRRSRGLDFSRAATSLHHSTLAEQPPPDSSPTISSSSGGIHGAMAIPGNRISGDYSGAPESSTSLWSMMGRGTRDTRIGYPSSSLGSTSNAIACSDSSSSSGDDDSMDEDIEEPFVTTPQVGKTIMPSTTDGPRTAVPWLPSSPAMGSLISFQHRQRPRRRSKRKIRGPLGLGFSSLASPANSVAGTGSSSGSGSGIANVFSRSPPGTTAQNLAHRRESISWAANQLHISGGESDDNLRALAEGGDGLASTPGRDGQRNVIRRAVTRRGNLLPKTKGFARIRAALAEENAPAEAEFRREAEVVRQVLESEVEQSSLPPPPPLRSATTTANSSPKMFDNLEDVMDDFMAMDASSSTTGLGLPATNPRHPSDRSAGSSRLFWEKPDLNGGASAISALRSLRATTPPPPRARGSVSSSGVTEDISMDSPLGGGVGPLPEAKNRQGGTGTGYFVYPHGAIFPMTATSSPGGGTPQLPGLGSSSSGGQQQHQPQHQQTALPSAAEITRRINSKRRCEDDLDPVSFKRRAVSPGMSVHSSPVMQSSLQRDVPPWGGLTATAAVASRSGSAGGHGGSNTSLDGSGIGGSGRVVGSNKGRVGYQAMADANDSITRLSIE